MKKQNKTPAIEMIEVEKLKHHPQNPRREIGDIEELAESVKAKGIMQNLTVVPDGAESYVVVIGNRRLEAAKKAGLDRVPCVVADMTEAEQVQTMLLENMQRTDLTIYEQAKGFQMMLDFGDTVETVAEKTGFSKATIKKRLRLNELDDEDLKDISGRQVTMADFDALFSIEDATEREGLLDSIGTVNFNAQVEGARRRQKCRKNMPLLKAEFERLGATPIERHETWSGRYDNVVSWGTPAGWDGKPVEVPEKVSQKKLFYVLTDWDAALYVKAEKAPANRKTPEELARERAIAENVKALDELNETVRATRRKFVESLRYTKANAEIMLDGAASAAALNMFSYGCAADKVPVGRALGLEWDYAKADECKKKIFQLIGQKKDRAYPVLIYGTFNDTYDATRPYVKYSSNSWPEYNEYGIRRVEMLYEWLTRLGYEMSDDEIGLLNGTHELYKGKQRYEESLKGDAGKAEGQDVVDALKDKFNK